MSALDELGIAVQIRARPNEVDPAIPFADDHTHASYDPHAVQLFLHTTYVAAADRGKWDRAALEGDSRRCDEKR